MSDDRKKIPEHRMQNFKNRGILKTDELRRRREDVAVELRKQKREESLAKRRNLAAVEGTQSESEDESMAMGSGAQVLFRLHPFRTIDLLYSSPLLALEIVPRANEGNG